MAFVAKYTTSCKACGATILPGQHVSKVPGVGTVHFPKCVYKAKAGAQLIPQHVQAAMAKAPKITVQGVTMQVPTGVVVKTQKAKGIKVLQSAGMLSSSYAQVATDISHLEPMANKIGLPCFVRPCPITPRHGFVDSRPVKTLAEVQQVWQEAKAADPQAELILMPFIQASHNMVWRPGLLSIGPGHDGATAGRQSISVFLQPEYSQAWKNLAVQAGCDLDQSDPFIEAVSSKAHETVVTQIRAGVKGCPTESNWNPQSFTIGEVVTIDPAHKADEGAMLAWESTAKGLKSGYHCVWNPGGNLGDHWSVHAQLAGIAVVTDFKPVVGQQLPKMGQELVDLEPQAIIFGYLGGLIGPSLLEPLMRKRAVCAAILGTHHGIRMGGDAGVFIGASVAMMLRLSQAALWGEARHAKAKGITGLSRDQIYKQILDDWTKGREGLVDKISLFWSHQWPGGYGGPAWAACSKATVDLDASMLSLIQVPSRVNAKRVLACLTNVVNLAHNNGWWMNKFCESTWFDMAADLDPRVALMAGPAWYEAATVPADQRMQLLAKLEHMSPLDVAGIEAKYFTANVAKKAAKLTNKAKQIQQQVTVAKSITDLPNPVSMGEQAHGHKAPTGKAGAYNMHYGDTLVLSGQPTKLQAIMQGATLHIQARLADLSYVSIDVNGCPKTVAMLLDDGQTAYSMAGTHTVYYKLNLVTIDNHHVGIGLDGFDAMIGVLQF